MVISRIASLGKHLSRSKSSYRNKSELFDVCAEGRIQFQYGTYQHLPSFNHKNQAQTITSNDNFNWSTEWKLCVANNIHDVSEPMSFRIK